jgi:hypothetical protein
MIVGMTKPKTIAFIAVLAIARLLIPITSLP